MTHEERARKIANLINSQKFSGLLEDLLAAEFAEVERYPVHSDCEHGNCQLCIILHEAERENLDRIAQLEADLRAAHGSVDLRDKRIAQLEAAADPEQRVYALCYEAMGGPVPPVGPPLHVKIRLMREALEKADALASSCKCVNYGSGGPGSSDIQQTYGHPQLTAYQAARARMRKP